MVLSLVVLLPLLVSAPLVTAVGEPTADRADASPNVTSSDATLEDRSGDADVELSSAAENATNEEITVVLRLTELRDHDAPRLEAAANRPDIDVRQELKSHAATTQSAVETDLDRRRGVEVHSDFWITNALVVSVDTAKTDPRDLADLPHVERIHDNYEIEPAAGTATIETSSGPLAIEPSIVGDTAVQDDYTDGLAQIGAPDAWDEFDNRGEGSSVAVLDTGIDPDHPAFDFDENNWQEWDSHGDPISSDPYDQYGHGTHVSGIVAGNDHAGQSIGVAPGTELYVGGVFPPDGGTFATVASGIEWAVENDVAVINLSLGSTDGQFTSDLIEPIENARDSGAVVVASVGNEGDGQAISPGNYWNVLSVGASDHTGRIADFSGGMAVPTDDAWDDELAEEWPDEYTVPHVSAPGVDVLSAVPNDSYGSDSGTSMAAPHVAGTAALVVAENPELSPAEIEPLLEATAAHPETVDRQDTRYGYGIVDAHSAVGVATGDAYLEGTVIDTDGEPVAGATVEADHEAETNRNGIYSMVVEPGERTLRVTAPGYTTTSTTASVAEGETKLVEDLRIERLGSFSGSVVDTDGEPVADATVVLRSDGDRIDELATDGDGTYEFLDVDPGTYTLVIDADGYALEETSVDLDPGERDERTVTLIADDDATATVDGSVSLAVAPVEPTEVTVTIEDETGTVATETVTVDAERTTATYAVDVPEAADREYRLTATAAGYESDAVEQLSLEEGATTTVDLELAATVELYADADGSVDVNGLRAAIGDWRAGDVDVAVLREVITYWRSGEPVAP